MGSTTGVAFTVHRRCPCGKPGRAFCLEKHFFVQGFGFFPLLQVSKQNCCLPALPAHVLCHCRTGPEFSTRGDEWLWPAVRTRILWEFMATVRSHFRRTLNPLQKEYPDAFHPEIGPPGVPSRRPPSRLALEGAAGLGRACQGSRHGTTSPSLAQIILPSPATHRPVSRGKLRWLTDGAEPSEDGTRLRRDKAWAEKLSRRL